MRVESNYDLLLYHCAPTLFKKKSASLFSLSGIDTAMLPYIIKKYSHLINSVGLKVTLLCSCKKNALIYVYNEELLSGILTTPEIRSFLKQYGYPECGTASEYIDVLKSHFSGSCGFPHEIGIFLDYPLDDVRGFINNKGKNYIHCGDWKVYSNIKDALRRFDLYRNCRECVSDMLRRGLSANEILHSGAAS